MCNISEKTKEFISKAVSKYGVKFDYSKVDYKNCRTKITLICDKGHEFKQRPDNHLRGKGCPTCATEAQTKTTDQFIIDAKAIHGNKFDYSKVDYKTSKIKVTLICDKGHEFEQEPRSHLCGNGCPTCVNDAKTKTANQFIMDAKAIHGNKFDYSKVNYKQSHTNVSLICDKGHEFEQRPSNHLSGNGCPTCANVVQTKTTDQFIMDAKVIHGNKFDYSKVNYKQSHTKITLICNKNHEFKQMPNDHLRGQGCPKCSKSISKPETIWLDILGIIERTKSLKLSSGKRTSVDGYDPITNTVYEFHGDFWHGNPAIFDETATNNKNKKTFGQLYQETINKENMIKNDGYNLVTIWEKEFYEKYSEQIKQIRKTKVNPSDNDNDSFGLLFSY